MADAVTRAAVYRSAVSALRDAARTGTDAQRDAANLLLASAHEGLARLAAGDAAQGESSVLDQASRLRAAADLYVGEMALAASLAGVDPEVERAELDGAIEDVRRRAEEARSRRDDLTSQRSALVLEAEGHAARAKEHAAEAGRLRSAALDAAPDSAPAIAQHAYEAQRRGAQEEVASSRLRARAELIEPSLTEQTLLIQSLQAEEQALAEAVGRVDQRVRDAESSAQSARASARSAADDAARTLDQIQDARDAADERWAEAVNEAESAVAALRQARGIDRTTLSIRLGEAQQRLGEIHAARHRGMERYAGQVGLLEQIEPPLPFADRLHEIASGLATASGQAVSAAKEAFEGAVSAYQRASTRDAAVRDRLERAQALLSRHLDGGASDAGAGAAADTPG